MGSRFSSVLENFTVSMCDMRLLFFCRMPFGSQQTPAGQSNELCSKKITIFSIAKTNMVTIFCL